MAVRVLVGAQWGDEGRGKIVDWLGRSAVVIACHAGGPNAGHTVVVGGETTILHHVGIGCRIRGRVTQDFPDRVTDLAAAEPVYEELPGWSKPLDGVGAERDQLAEMGGTAQVAAAARG